MDVRDLPRMDSNLEGKATDPYFKLYLDGCKIYSGLGNVMVTIENADV